MTLVPDPNPPDDRAEDAVAAHLIALAQLPRVGPATLLHWHRTVGAVAAWQTILAGNPTAIRREANPRAPIGDTALAALIDAARHLDPHAELDRNGEVGRVLVEGRPDYPARLAEDIAPPAVVFALGDLGALSGPTVAIVGTRNATRPGRDLAAGLGAELAAAGVTVVSGLALGIDAAAHRGALHAADQAARADHGSVGSPVAVIASGLDIAYPRRHVELHREVAARGLLLTEVPAGRRPTEWRFPARNRIIAGLADAVVVVESRTKGGSIGTAGEALDRGVTVLAVPGHPSSPASAGTNDLLFDGAGIVRSVADVLAAIGVEAAPERAPSGSGPMALDPTRQAVLDAVGDAPAALAEVVVRCGLELEDVSQALVALEASGHLVRTSGWFERADRRVRSR